MKHIVKVKSIDNGWRMANGPIHTKPGDMVEIHNLDGSIDYLLVRAGTCNIKCCMYEKGGCIRYLEGSNKNKRCIISKSTFVDVGQVMEEL